MKNNLFNKMKKFINNNKNSRRIKEIDMYNFIENISYSISEYVYERNTKLFFDLEDSVPEFILVDLYKLKKSLINMLKIIINSGVFSEIIVEVKAKNDRLYFFIYDYSTNLSKQKLAKIFNDYDDITPTPHVKKFFDGKYIVQYNIKFKLIEKSNLRFDDISNVALVVNNSINMFFMKKFLNSLNIAAISYSETDDLKNLIFNKNKITEFSYIFISDYFLTDNNKEFFKIIQEDYILKEKVIILIFEINKLLDLRTLKINYIIANPLLKYNLYQNISTYHKRVCNTLAERKNKIILIVEDNEINAEVFLEYLKLCDLKGEIAVSGEDAIKKIEKFHYDMVFTDIQLPDIDGFEIARLIRKKNKLIPVIAVTVQLYSGYEEKYSDAGIDEYIAKPVIFEELQKILFKYLNLVCIDFEELKEEYGEKIFSVLVKNHLKFIPTHLNEFEKTLEGVDKVAIKKSAHKLKGSICNFKMNKILRLLNEIIHSEIELNEMKTDGKIIIEEIENLNKELIRYQKNDESIDE